MKLNTRYLLKDTHRQWMPIAKVSYYETTLKIKWLISTEKDNSVY